MHTGMGSQKISNMRRAKYKLILFTEQRHVGSDQGVNKCITLLIISMFDPLLKIRATRSLLLEPIALCINDPLLKIRATRSLLRETIALCIIDLETIDFS